MARPKPQSQDDSQGNGSKDMPDGNKDAFNALLRQAVPDEQQGHKDS